MIGLFFPRGSRALIEATINRDATLTPAWQTLLRFASISIWRGFILTPATSANRTSGTLVVTSRSDPKVSVLRRDAKDPPTRAAIRATIGSHQQDGDHTLPQQSMTEDLSRSVGLIDQAVANFVALREEFRSQDEHVIELRAKLEAEKVQQDHLRCEIVRLEQSSDTERERAVRAEGLAANLQDVIENLDEQLTSLRDQVGRLVKSVSHLMEVQIRFPA